MSQIIVTDDQARILSESTRRVEVRDRSGNLIGYATPAWTLDEIAEARRRAASSGPRYTTAEVHAHLKALDSP